MPYYDFVCSKCGCKELVVCSIIIYEETKNERVCKCGGKMERLWSPVVYAGRARSQGIKA